MPASGFRYGCQPPVPTPQTHVRPVPARLGARRVRRRARARGQERHVCDSGPPRDTRHGRAPRRLSGRAAERAPGADQLHRPGRRARPRPGQRPVQRRAALRDLTQGRGRPRMLGGSRRADPPVRRRVVTARHGPGPCAPERFSAARGDPFPRPRRDSRRRQCLPGDAAAPGGTRVRQPRRPRRRPCGLRLGPAHRTDHSLRRDGPQLLNRRAGALERAGATGLSRHRPRARGPQAAAGGKP